MTALVRYDEARRAVQACVKVDEAKSIADKAKGLQAYARQAHDPELESWVAEIRIRARVRIGELSAELEKTQGSNLPNVAASRRSGKSKRDTLQAAGISKDEAHRCEKLKALRDADPRAFERVVAEKRAEKKAITADDLERAVRKSAKPDERKPRADPESTFDSAGEVLKVVRTIRTVAAYWPDELDLEPMIAILKRETNRLEERRARLSK
jgi:hypothetical protein